MKSFVLSLAVLTALGNSAFAKSEILGTDISQFDTIAEKRQQVAKADQATKQTSKSEKAE